MIFLSKSLIYIIFIIGGYYVFKYNIKYFERPINFILKRIPPIQSYKILAVFRILQSFCLIILSLYLFELIPFTFYHKIASNNWILFFQILHLIWIATNILIILGSHKRSIYIINFLLTFYLLGGNIGDHMLKLASFWMIFIRPCDHYSYKNDKFKALGFNSLETKISQDWAVYLMGINLSFIITVSGIFKFLDPVWRNGLGFYYAYLQPWIHVSWTSFVLDYKFFVYSMNFLGILFETLPFFLFFFNKTRLLSIFFMFCFVGLVNFPLRIDPVGPAGLIIIIGLSSLLSLKVFNNKEFKSR